MADAISSPGSGSRSTAAPDAALLELSEPRLDERLRLGLAVAAALRVRDPRGRPAAIGAHVDRCHHRPDQFLGYRSAKKGGRPGDDAPEQEALGNQAAEA